jgi:hypothetical protein
MFWHSKCGANRWQDKVKDSDSVLEVLQICNPPPIIIIIIIIIINEHNYFS